MLQKEVQAKKLAPLDPVALRGGSLAFVIGVGSTSLFVRCICMGFQMAAIVGALFVWPLAQFLLQNDTVPVPGLWYCVLKATLAAVVSWASFPGTFCGALSAANFPGWTKAE